MTAIMSILLLHGQGRNYLPTLSEVDIGPKAMGADEVEEGAFVRVHAWVKSRVSWIGQQERIGRAGDCEVGGHLL